MILFVSCHVLFVVFTIPCVSLYMQNDLVHGWGLDFALRKCVEVHCSFRLVTKISQWGSMNVLLHALHLV